MATGSRAADLHAEPVAGVALAVAACAVMELVVAVAVYLGVAACAVVLVGIVVVERVDGAVVVELVERIGLHGMDARAHKAVPPPPPPCPWA